jgi:hypothetical protein
MNDASCGPRQCRLSPSRLQRRRLELERIAADTGSTLELSGSTLAVTSSADHLQTFLDLISFERQCCPFLDYELVARASGELRLRVSLPPNLKESS